MCVQLRVQRIAGGNISEDDQDDQRTQLRVQRIASGNPTRKGLAKPLVASFGCVLATI